VERHRYMWTVSVSVQKRIMYIFVIYCFILRNLQMDFLQLQVLHSTIWTILILLFIQLPIPWKKITNQYWIGTGTSTFKRILVCLFMIKSICIGRFWIFYRLNFVLIIIMFVLKISFEIWSWFNFFKVNVPATRDTQSRAPRANREVGQDEQ
jgi:hypothetical protein